MRSTGFRRKLVCVTSSFASCVRSFSDSWAPGQVRAMFVRWSPQRVVATRNWLLMVASIQGRDFRDQASPDREGGLRAMARDFHLRTPNLCTPELNPQTPEP